MRQNPVIVVPAYQREKSLERLLNSLLAADLSDCPKIVISIEGNAPSEVMVVAEAFAAKVSLCDVRQQPARLGLRQHILACGDLALEYGSVIVLEDDLWVDRHFYRYATSALAFYEGQPKIAGIALYGPQLNEYAGLPFSPMNNGYSTYFMQIPCSWGQAWSADQWQAFRNWYDQASEPDVQNVRTLPQNVKDWPESSWKKYFAAYMVLADQTFVYPYLAYSTNCSDPNGTHIQAGSDRFQVPLSAQGRPMEALDFCPSCDDLVAYDPFYEAVGASVFEDLELDPEDIEVDTYGSKPVELLQEKRLVLTSRPVATEDIHRSHPLAFRPVESNLGFQTSGHHRGGLHIVESTRLRERGSPPSLDQISYFFDINMRSLRTLLKVLLALPGTLADRIKTRFRH